VTEHIRFGEACRVLLALAIILVAPGAAVSAERGFGGHPEPEIRAHEHLDARFAHNRPYLDRGYAVREIPRTGYAIDHGHDRYWYDGGHWYRRDGLGWLVVGAPLGVFVSVLPPFYTTVWYGGVPYYYANDTYYAWQPEQQAYEVVEPPAGIEVTGSTQAPNSDTLFVYPRNGQSSDLQSRDRFECHQSAVQQTGFDPTVAGGGVPPDLAASKRSDYHRAEAACLEARGYSVK